MDIFYKIDLQFIFITYKVTHTSMSNIVYNF